MCRMLLTQAPSAQRKTQGFIVRMCTEHMVTFWPLTFHSHAYTLCLHSSVWCWSVCFVICVVSVCMCINSCRRGSEGTKHDPSVASLGVKGEGLEVNGAVFHLHRLCPSPFLQLPCSIPFSKENYSYVCEREGGRERGKEKERETRFIAHDFIAVSL